MKMGMLYLKGQVTVFVLLLALLGLTVGMSAASRSLSDLKQSTYVESGTKALSGAEAGLQYSLSQVSNGTATMNCNNVFTDVTSAVSGGLVDFSKQFTKIEQNTCMKTANYYSQDVLADDVMDIDVSGASGITGFRISWTDASPATVEAAVEVALLDSNYNVSRYVYSGTNNVASNNFSLSNTSTACGFSGRSFTVNASGTRLVRVRPLFAGATIAVCGIDATGATVAIPNQYYVVQVRAVTKDGATKRLQAQKISTGLPSPFDFVFFSGGNIVKN